VAAEKQPDRLELSLKAVLSVRAWDGWSFAMPLVLPYNLASFLPFCCPVSKGPEGRSI
jgi:hypothetical protein